MKKLYWEEMEGKEVVVEVNGIENYKDAILTIFNNVREHPYLYTVENNSENKIYVTGEPEQEEAIKEWLSQWGEIKRVNTVLVLKLCEPDYDLDKYDDVKVVWE